jgi:succinoglycan biosynthesis protein ExoM
MQPKKNIALTRNMGVANATGEYIAFIDDDEYADPDWLSTLYAALHKYEADVVFGPVVGVLPNDAPEWIKEGGFFKGLNQPSGSLLINDGATGNVLLRAAALPDRLAPFNPKYGLSGGEDTDFFLRLRLSGAKLVWCNEAGVREIVTSDRMTVSWLIRRSFRGGQMFAEICVTHDGWQSWVRWLVYRFTLAMVALVGALFGWPIKRAWGVKCFQKVASNIGQLSSLFSYRYKEYSKG